VRDAEPGGLRLVDVGEDLSYLVVKKLGPAAIEIQVSQKAVLLSDVVYNYENS